jgi:hypothetical protein
MDDVHALELEISASELELADLTEPVSPWPSYRPIVIHGAATAEDAASRYLTSSELPPGAGKAS